MMSEKGAAHSWWCQKKELHTADDVRKRSCTADVIRKRSCTQLMMSENKLHSWWCQKKELHSWWCQKKELHSRWCQKKELHRWCQKKKLHTADDVRKEAAQLMMSEKEAAQLMMSERKQNKGGKDLPELSILSSCSRCRRSRIFWDRILCTQISLQTILHYRQHQNLLIKHTLYWNIQSSRTVWESRWPSWAVHPNDVKLYWTMLPHWSQLVQVICQPTSEDIKQHNHHYWNIFKIHSRNCLTMKLIMCV